MAKLDDLISQIPDGALRAELADAAREIRRRQRFGLVFEEHVPELSCLPDFPITTRVTAYRRQDVNRENPLRVEKIDGKAATVRPIPEGDIFSLPIEDLLVLKRFGEPVYPSLRLIESLQCAEGRPYHSLISGENFHALQLLTFLYRGKVDCMYLDPPYNTGARDWKYNNDYVDANDAWRHSKWLSMMEKRLQRAKQLLKPSGVMIVTIDEHEVHHLGILLDQVMPEYQRQLVTIVTNPKGVTRPQGGLSRVEEYAIFCFPEGSVMEGRGDDLLTPIKSRSQEASVSSGGEKPRWQGLLHSGQEHRREDRESMFYPVLIDEARGAVVGAGEPLLPIRDDSGEIIEWPEPDLTERIDGHTAVWPVRSDGSWGRWYIGAKTLRHLAEKGYVSLGRHDPKRQTWALRYLYRSLQKQIETGELKIVKSDQKRNVVDVRYTAVPRRRLKTVWHRSRHDAGAYGADLLGDFLGARKFPFPKSLYSVRDALAAVVSDNPSALIVDFFAGSGTTLHATSQLNQEDGGRRQCLLITNNEVEEKIARELVAKGSFPGDADFEQNGICEAVTWPRCKAAITGRRIDGEAVPGTYLDGRSYSEGYNENCAFFRLDYLDPDEVELGRQFTAVLPALWLAAGARGPLPSEPPRDGMLLPKDSPFAVLLRESAFRRFSAALEERGDVTHAWIVTDSSEAFAEMRSLLDEKLSVSMLYRDYLRTFEINTDRTV